MTLQFQIYKLNTDDNGHIVMTKYSTPLFDTFSFDLNSPISPMPLPEDTSTSNILVKMEGNSSQINFGWKIVPNQLGTFKTSDFGTEKQKPYDGHPRSDSFHFKKMANNSAIVFTDLYTGSDSFAMMKIIFEKLESTSVRNSFAFNIYDDVEDADKFTQFGSISSIRGSVDPATPTIWNISLDFLVGHVISIYDADTPEKPTDFIITQGANVDNVRTIQYSFKAPSRIGGSPILSYNLSWETEDLTSSSTTNVLVAALTLTGTTYTHTLTLTGITAANKVKGRVNAVNSGGGGTSVRFGYLQLT